MRRTDDSPRECDLSLLRVVVPAVENRDMADHPHKRCIDGGRDIGGDGVSLLFEALKPDLDQFVMGKRIPYRLEEAVRDSLAADHHHGIERMSLASKVSALLSRQFHESIVPHRRRP